MASALLDLSQPIQVRIAERLGSDVIIWLGTTRPNGDPHLVPVWFFWEDDEQMLVFSKSDQKIRNLRHHGYATLALETEHDGERVTILRGPATVLEESTAEIAPSGFWDKYGARISAMNMTNDSFAADYHAVIRIRPEKLIAW